MPPKQTSPSRIQPAIPKKYESPSKSSKRSEEGPPPEAYEAKAATQSAVKLPRAVPSKIEPLPPSTQFPAGASKQSEPRPGLLGTPLSYNPQRHDFTPSNRQEQDFNALTPQQHEFVPTRSQQPEQQFLEWASGRPEERTPPRRDLRAPLAYHSAPPIIRQDQPYTPLISSRRDETILSSALRKENCSPGQARQKEKLVRFDPKVYQKEFVPFAPFMQSLSEEEEFVPFDSVLKMSAQPAGRKSKAAPPGLMQMDPQQVRPPMRPPPGLSRRRPQPGLQRMDPLQGHSQLGPSSGQYQPAPPGQPYKGAPRGQYPLGPPGQPYRGPPRGQYPPAQYPPGPPFQPHKGPPPDQSAMGPLRPQPPAESSTKPYQPRSPILHSLSGHSPWSSQADTPNQEPKESAWPIVTHLAPHVAPFHVQKLWVKDVCSGFAPQPQHDMVHRQPICKNKPCNTHWGPLHIETHYAVNTGNSKQNPQTGDYFAWRSPDLNICFHCRVELRAQEVFQRLGGERQWVLNRFKPAYIENSSERERFFQAVLEAKTELMALGEGPDEYER